MHERLPPSKESFLKGVSTVTLTVPEALQAAQLPPLPHWESTPDELKAAIREIKPAIRARIAASGRSVEEVFAVVEARIATAVAEIEAAKARGEEVWPVIDYA